jgi:6-phosphofructokinase 1
VKRIAVLTSGGDAPGMNAAIRAVTRAALARGWEAFGVRNGFAGLLEDALEPLAARDVGGIIQRGGTVLGSARSPEFREKSARDKVRAQLAARGVDALVVIGGNGSQTGSAVLAAEGCAVVGVASTIDNDLHGTDVSIGADTAINVTLESIDRLRTTASSHRRVFIVETMGRDCGYIALMAGIGGGAEVIAIPEREVPPAEVADRLRAAYERGKTHAMVVVAEGAKHGVHAMVAYFEGKQQVTGFGLRITRLGHVVRGGVPTSADRVLGSRLGAAAVECLADGVTGMLVGEVRGEIVRTPLAEVAGRTRPADTALIELARVLAM